jgi:hypothetical protein
MRSVFFIGAVALALAASGVAASPEPNVRGSLTRGPIMPVCIEGRSCDAPAVGVVLVFSKAGRDVRRVTTGTAGRFTLRLEPGLYAVRAARKPVLGTVVTPTRFRVATKGMTTLRLHLDTGIR